MVITKLNGSHSLYYSGFTHALRFRRKTKEFLAIKSALHEQGYQHGKDFRTFQSRKGNPLWLGVKDVRVLTHVLLCVKL